MKLQGSRSYNLKILHRGRYIHAVMAGVESFQHLMDAWRKIAKECHMQACTRILCEGGLEVAGMTIGAEEYGKAISGIGMPVGSRIAFICDEEKSRGSAFRERTVTTKIPVFTKIFFTVEEGVTWLTK